MHLHKDKYSQFYETFTSCFTETPSGLQKHTYMVLTDSVMELQLNTHTLIQTVLVEERLFLLASTTLVNLASCLVALTTSIMSAPTLLRNSVTLEETWSS